VEGFAIKDLEADSGALRPLEFRQKHGDGFLMVFARSGEKAKRKQVATELGTQSTSSIDIRIFAVKSDFEWIDVGRTPNCDITIPDSTISKLHAWFRSDGSGGFTLFDAGSRNGTRVNDQPVEQRGNGNGTELTGNSSIEFGSVRARYVTASTLQDFVCSVTQQKKPA
jgi:pSer/pThr/pTyr-binding forkhead associated (FHA) protein